MSEITSGCPATKRVELEFFLCFSGNVTGKTGICNLKTNPPFFRILTRSPKEVLAAREK
jgi:hypothetical protein